jgi:hypothetical protein
MRKISFLSVWLPALYLKGLIEESLLHPVGLLLVGSQPILVQTLDLPAHTHSVGISVADPDPGSGIGFSGSRIPNPYF